MKVNNEIHTHHRLRFMLVVSGKVWHCRKAKLKGSLEMYSLGPWDESGSYEGSGKEDTLKTLSLRAQGVENETVAAGMNRHPQLTEPCLEGIKARETVVLSAVSLGCPESDNQFVWPS